MTERQKIIKDLTKLQATFQDNTWAGIIADFIIEDRRRICEPLVKYKDECKEPWGYPKSHLAIDQSLIKAGLEEK